MEKESISDVEENDKKINKLKTIIYACIITISIMVLLCSFVNYEFSILILSIPIILFIISIICRNKKKKRISNIICIISIIFICIYM